MFLNKKTRFINYLSNHNNQYKEKLKRNYA